MSVKDVELSQTPYPGSRYYNANRYSTPEEAEENGTWFIVYIGDQEEPYEEEFDVTARDRREAFAVAKAALKRDYEGDLQVTEMRLA